MQEKNLVCFVDDNTALKSKKTQKYHFISKKRAAEEKRILNWYKDKGEIKKNTDPISKYLSLE